MKVKKSTCLFPTLQETQACSIYLISLGHRHGDQGSGANGYNTRSLELKPRVSPSPRCNAGDQNGSVVKARLEVRSQRVQNTQYRKQEQGTGIQGRTKVQESGRSKAGAVEEVRQEGPRQG